MNIAVNARLLLKNKLEGIGWFSYETLKRITREHPEHKFYFIFDRPHSPEFVFSDNVIPIVVGPQTRHPILWYLWFEFVIPRVLKKINADIFISTDGFISLKAKIPQVSVIHDINFVHNPEQLPYFVRKYYNYFFPKYAKKASSIGTVSEYSKKDICETFNVNPDLITVCYNGSNSVYSPLDEVNKKEVKATYTQDKDYFIFVGAFTPRKNIPGLLKSFEIFKSSGDFSQKLVIVGSELHTTVEIKNTLEEMVYKNDVIFTGRLNLESLHKYLGSALALVYIPFFEGFGIPLVEAMHCEIPIISGDRTSLPEVVGEAALICSPEDHKKVAFFMTEIVNKPELRESLILKARVQREMFSWDKSAQRLWNCIEKVI
ncbi:MAG: glycosyltransferase family 1 protein [Bacteroidales bacterium]|nr:glycosyltransferase family 1 protein [Bacteroidales bacterium]MDD3859687.1 glycosyltransferase family 1 protein [Bacteroidales bacterium]